MSEEWAREDPIYPREEIRPWRERIVRPRLLDYIGERCKRRENGYEMAIYMHHVPCYGCGRWVHGQNCYNFTVDLVICDPCKMAIARSFRAEWDVQQHGQPPFDIRTLDWNYWEHP